jgi:hypothetical protein
MRFLSAIKENSARIQTSLSNVIKIVLILSLLNAFYFHLWHILFANAFLLFLMFVPYFMKKGVHIQLPKEFELAVLFFVVISFFMGEIRGFVIQAFFGLAIGLIGFTLMIILYSNSKTDISPWLIVLFAFSFSVTIGFGIELIKYHLKLFLDYKFSVADYSYAMNGLTWVCGGAFLSAIAGYGYMKKYRITKLRFIRKFVDRFKHKNPNFFLERSDSPEDVLELIKKGEGEKTEFKSTLRTNLHTNELDKKIENSAIKTITAFLNSGGGTLLVGVSDIGEISGIEKDNFESNDKFSLHFTNLLKQKIGHEYFSFLDFKLILIEGKNILKVDCLKSNKPVFMRTSEGEKFYVRTGPASVELNGSKILEYIKNNFEK